MGERQFRERPTKRLRRDDVLRLVDAAHGARFVLHAELLSAQSRGEQGVEDCEVIGEMLAELQAALSPIYGEQGVPPICRGCSPIRPFEQAEGKGSK